MQTEARGSQMINVQLSESLATATDGGNSRLHELCAQAQALRTQSVLLADQYRAAQRFAAREVGATLVSVMAVLEETARIQKETAELLWEVAHTPDQANRQRLSKARNLLQQLDAVQVTVPAQPGPGDAQPRRTPGQQGPGSVKEPLTTKEQAVLRLLATSLSPGEISQHMHISPNTLKSHTRAIYRKLGATHRREAVRRGQELAILRSKRTLLKSGRY